jgi:hypothetical protein
MVRHRTQELGIRLALGAAPRDLRHMVMRRGLAIAAAGLVPGLLGALLANRLLAALLYQVSPTDGVTLVVTAGLLLGVAGLASAIPAQFSTRVDPVSALRDECRWQSDPRVQLGRSSQRTAVGSTSEWRDHDASLPTDHRRPVWTHCRGSPASALPSLADRPCGLCSAAMGFMARTCSGWWAQRLGGAACASYASLTQCARGTAAGSLVISALAGCLSWLRRR